MEGVGGLACPVGVWFPEPSFPGSECGAVWQRQALVSDLGTSQPCHVLAV